MGIDTDRRFEAICEVINRLPDPAKTKGVARGTIECPLCKTGSITYRVESGRGRRAVTQGRCSTDNCLQFMS